MKRLPGTGYRSDIWLSEYLAERGIACTGSPHDAVRLEFSKQLAKRIVQNAGLPTAAFFTTNPGQHTDVNSLPLPFPLFVKPAHSGGGDGIDANSVVNNYSQFKQKVADIHANFHSGSLVEKYLTGREFTVAVLGNTEDEQLIMPVEIITEPNKKGDRILGRKVKTDDTELVIPVKDFVLRKKLIALARSIFLVLGARNLGRIDIRMDGEGNAYFLEANLIPGMGNMGGYFWQAYKLNQIMSYESMILHIAKLSIDLPQEVLPTSLGLLVEA